MCIRNVKKWDTAKQQIKYKIKTSAMININVGNQQILCIKNNFVKTHFQENASINCNEFSTNIGSE